MNDEPINEEGLHVSRALSAEDFLKLSEAPEFAAEADSPRAEGRSPRLAEMLQERVRLGDWAIDTTALRMAQEMAADLALYQRPFGDIDEVARQTAGFTDIVRDVFSGGVEQIQEQMGAMGAINSLSQAMGNTEEWASYALAARQSLEDIDLYPGALSAAEIAANLPKGWEHIGEQLQTIISTGRESYEDNLGRLVAAYQQVYDGGVASQLASASEVVTSSLSGMMEKFDLVHGNLGNLVSTTFGQQLLDAGNVSQTLLESYGPIISPAPIRHDSFYLPSHHRLEPGISTYDLVSGPPPKGGLCFQEMWISNGTLSQFENLLTHYFGVGSSPYTCFILCDENDNYWQIYFCDDMDADSREKVAMDGAYVGYIYGIDLPRSCIEFYAADDATWAILKPFVRVIEQTMEKTGFHFHAAERKKRGQNAGTVAKLEALINLRNERKINGTVTLTRVVACGLVGIDVKTVKRHAIELWERWEDWEF